MPKGKRMHGVKLFRIRPESGDYWHCDYIHFEGRNVSTYYFVTVKDMVDFLESHPGTVVQYVRQV